MTFNELKQNIQRIKEIVREMYIFTNQLEVIGKLETGGNIIINIQEKNLLRGTINSLQVQLDILNNSIPALVEGIGFFQSLSAYNRQILPPKLPESRLPETSLVKVNYKPEATKPHVSLSVGEKDRQLFLENLSASNLSINQLKKKYGIEKPVSGFGKPSFYATLSNRYFRKTSNKLVLSGRLEKLNADLREMNSPFVVGTYVSMILFSVSIAFILSILLFIGLLFFNISFTFPFFSIVKESILLRALKIFWVIFAIPIITGFLMYFYPHSESKNIGAKIDQELPFVAIHMSAIATSGVEPVNIFRVIIKNEEYRYSRLEFRKLLNLINFHGADLVSALKRVSNSSPSSKLRELLDGFATTITSGGDLHKFLEKHAETLLFD